MVASVALIVMGLKAVAAVLSAILRLFHLPIAGKLAALRSN